MDDQTACANTSRRSGLRATKRIDYSTLEGGALDEEEQIKKASKENASPEVKVKKVPSAKKRRLSTELSSPPTVKDDDGDWDDDGNSKRSGGPFKKLHSSSAQALDWKGMIHHFHPSSPSNIV
jgi:hypothetical protein